MLRRSKCGPTSPQNSELLGETPADLDDETGSALTTVLIVLEHEHWKTTRGRCRSHRRTGPADVVLRGRGALPGVDRHNERTESTDSLGFAIVVDGEGNGRVVGTLVNTSDQPQALVGAEVESERGPVRAVVDEDLPLPPNEPVELARDAAIAGSAADLPEGLFVELTLTIDGALEPIEMLVPVEPQDGPYAEIEVTEAPDGDVSP